MKPVNFIGVLLTASSALGSPYTHGLFGRQDSGQCQIQLPQSSGGRKVAIVLDSSGSMSYNDPDNLRVIAGKSLAKQLVPASGASSGSKPDLLTVIDFDDSAKVIYPLGDPAGADSSFNEIDSDGGTWIADGVDKALGELTKSGFDPTADRTGILVLTDGEDSDVAGLISQIQKAGSAGIRVSFGFLAPSDSFFEPDLLSAILKTGGTYSSFASADAVQSFLFLVLSNGLTAIDHASSAEQALLPGVTVAKLSGGKPVTFTYSAQASEKLLFSFESLSSQGLDGELEDASGKTIAKNSSDGSAPGSISYTAGSDGDLKFLVTSNVTAEGVFQVTLNSSLGIAGCNLTTVPTPSNSSTNGTGNGGGSGSGSGSGSGNGNGTVTTATPTPTPTGTLPPVVTAAAAKITAVGLPLLGVFLALLTL